MDLFGEDAEKRSSNHLIEQCKDVWVSFLSIQMKNGTSGPVWVNAWTSGIEIVECVDHSTYFGSLTISSRLVSDEISVGIQKGQVTFAIARHLWCK